MSRLSNETNFFDPLRFLETLFGPEAKSLRQLNASGFPLRLSLPEPVWSTSGLINLGRPRFPFTGLLTAGLSRIWMTSGDSEPKFSDSKSDFSELTCLFRFFGPLRQVLGAVGRPEGCVAGGRRFKSSSRWTWRPSERFYFQQSLTKIIRLAYKHIDEMVTDLFFAWQLWTHSRILSLSTTALEPLTLQKAKDLQRITTAGTASETFQPNLASGRKARNTFEKLYLIVDR